MYMLLLHHSQKKVVPVDHNKKLVQSPITTKKWYTVTTDYKKSLITKMV